MLHIEVHILVIVFLTSLFTFVSVFSLWDEGGYILLAKAIDAIASLFFLESLDSVWRRGEEGARRTATLARKELSKLVLHTHDATPLHIMNCLC